MPPVKMTRAEYQAKYGVAPGASVTPKAPVVTTPAPTTVTTPQPTTTTSAPVKMTRAQYQAKYGTAPAVSTPAPETTPTDGGSTVGNFVKGLVSAPATLVARPFQAAESLGQYLGSNTEELQKLQKEGSDNLLKLINLRKDKIARGEDVSHITKTINDIMNTEDSAAKEAAAQTNYQPSSGGIIAPAPQNFSDVKKDVGRAVQTVALGTGAPIAGGAAFGLGASLEQGNDLFSLQTALQTMLGAGAGKVLDLIGKPLLNAAGKVIGTITPQTLKDVAAGGADAVAKFAAQHEIVPAAAKPAINAIPKIAENIDTGVNQIFKGAGQKVAGAVQTQYPGATKENIAKHYEKVEVDRLMEPAKTAGKTYNKSAEVLKDSERRGIDLKKVAADNKVYASEHIKDGKFDTTGVADALSSEAMSGGPEILRPALAAAEPGVARVPISEVRQGILERISKVPDTKLSPKQKLAFAKKVAEEYADNSVTAARYKDGYSLTNLYDSKLQTSSSIYKAPKGGGVQSISDSLIGQQKQIESQVFDDLLRKRAPPEIGLDKYFKAQEGRFALANYLRTLDGNKAPQTLFQRGIRRAAQLGGATTGASVAGPFGMFSGYQFGGIVADTFASASNPVKVAFLKSIGKSEPEIYQIMREFTTDANIAKELRKGLSGPSKTSAPDLMKQQNKQGAVEMGFPFRETTAGEKFVNTTNQNTKRLFNTKQLPAPEPRTIVPNTQGTPNRLNKLYNAGGDAGEVGGMRQRVKPKK